MSQIQIGGVKRGIEEGEKEPELEMLPVRQNEKVPTGSWKEIENER